MPGELIGAAVIAAGLLFLLFRVPLAALSRRVPRRGGRPDAGPDLDRAWVIATGCFLVIVGLMTLADAMGS